MRNINIAPILPIAETCGANGRIAIINPNTISIVPISVETP
jgi:hypothetical protein